MKKIHRPLTSLLLAVALLTAVITSVSAVQPRYIGIVRSVPTLTISSSGAASCKGRTTLTSGYSADVTLELQQDGDTIKTWTTSGTGALSIDKVYYVVRGHDYTLKLTVEVYNSSGTLVESPSITTDPWEY